MQSRVSSCDECGSNRWLIANVHRVERGFTRGDEIPCRIGRSEGFWCIRTGHAKLSYVYAHLARPVRICGPGDLLGYGHWHCDERLVAEALEPLSACFIDREGFANAQRELPALGESVVKLACQVGLQMAQRSALLQSRSVRSRVAGVLMSLERKFGERTRRGSRIPAAIDRKTLASLAGTVVETLARVLTEFEEKGWIARDGHALHVHDRDALNALAHE